MSNYSLQYAAGTSSGNVVRGQAGLALGLGLGAVLLLSNLTNETMEAVKQEKIKLEQTSRTFGNYSFPVSGELNLTGDASHFEQKMASFYENLLYKQEPLGKDFEKVLYGNLRDLLIRI